MYDPQDFASYFFISSRAFNSILIVIAVSITSLYIVAGKEYLTKRSIIFRLCRFVIPSIILSEVFT